MVKNPIPAKITELASAIVRLVTTHENKTSSSTQKGHAQAGGAPQTIGTSLSAGTDNGYYARADHVHTINYSNILNKPTTFPPSSHNHDNTYYTKEEVDDLLNNVLLDRVFVDENGDLVIGTTIAGMLLSANKNIIQSNETSTLTATAYDAYSDIVIDQPLQLYKDDTLVGIFNTNNNGQIQYTYTGDGSGKHNFIVRNGRFVSEPCNIIDALFFDDASTNRSSEYNLYHCNLSHNNGEYTITRNGDGECYVDFVFNTSKGNLSEVVGKTIRFECEIISSDATMRLITYQYTTRWSATNGADATSGVLSVPSTAIGGVTIDNTATSIQFRISANNLGSNQTLKFKNFKLYVV